MDKKKMYLVNYGFLSFKQAIGVKLNALFLHDKHINPFFLYHSRDITDIFALFN